MLKITISRDDHIYNCFPDIAMAKDGTLVCVYRESMGHAPFPFSRIAVRRSLDGGKNWLERKILVECVTSAGGVDFHRPWLSKDAIDGYEESKARIREEWQINSSINCPRLTCLNDGTLFLIVDFTLYDEYNKAHWTNKIWRSKDSGATWEGPELPELQEGLVPSITQLRNGDILLGLVAPLVPMERSFVCRSTDCGHTWSPPIFMPEKEGSQIDEVNYVELNDGTIIGFGRNIVAEREHRPTSGLKVISRDGGKTWNGLFQTWLVGLEGRPKPGLLASGEVCITYRCSIPNSMLAMHVVTQDAAKLEKLGEMIPRQPLPEDILSQSALGKKENRPWYMTSYYPGRTFIIDCDRSVHGDIGYSGWVQLPSGDIFVVDYINDDAPLAQIRGYIINRFDYILFPDGNLPSLHPSWQPFREMTYAMAKQQYMKNKEATCL